MLVGDNTASLAVEVWKIAKTVHLDFSASR